MMAREFAIAALACTLACGRLNFEKVPAPGDSSCGPFPASALDLTFTDTSVLDPRIAFSRPSVASYVGDGGLIQVASADVARFERDPMTGLVLGLLIEEARTNLLSGDRSEGLSADDGATAQSDVAVAPDGTLTADKLIESPSSMGSKTHYDAIAATANMDGRTYTWSVFAKAVERSEIALTGGNEQALAFFDLSSGTTRLDPSSPLGTRASIQALPNGWYRCAITYVRTGGTTNLFQFIMLAANGTNAYQGDGGSGAYFWGMQVEEGANATSYIRTAGTPVTRAADRAVLLGIDSLFGTTTAGTMSSAVLLRGFTNTDQVHYELSDGLSPSSRIGALTAGISTATNYVGDSAVLTTATSMLPVAGQIQRNAFTFSPDYFAASVNGGPTVLLAGPPSPRVSQLTIGHDYSQGSYLDGVVMRVRYFATPLSDADLQCLTQ